MDAGTTGISAFSVGCGKSSDLRHLRFAFTRQYLQTESLKTKTRDSFDFESQSNFSHQQSEACSKKSIPKRSVTLRFVGGAYDHEIGIAG